MFLTKRNRTNGTPGGHKEEAKRANSKKTAEIQRKNDAKINKIRSKLDEIISMESTLIKITDEMNEELSEHHKILKVKGSANDFLNKIDNLDRNDPDMKIPNKKKRLYIGVIYQSSKVQAREADATIRFDFKLDDDMVQYKFNGTEKKLTQ